MYNMLHVPLIEKTFLSISKLAQDNDVFFEFQPFSCFVKDQVMMQVFLKGRVHNGLYEFDLKLQITHMT